MRKYQAPVARGIAELDAKAPGWRDRIDPERLYLGRWCDCVYGQVFREDALTFDVEFVELGFMIREFDPTRYPAEYAELTNEWKRQLYGEDCDAEV